MPCDDPNCMCNSKPAALEKATEVLEQVTNRLQRSCPETSVVLALYDDAKASEGEIWRAHWVMGDATQIRAVNRDTIIASAADENPALAAAALAYYLRSIFLPFHEPPPNGAIQ